MGDSTPENEHYTQLRESIEKLSSRNYATLFSYFTILAYLFVTTVSTTHEDILFNTTKPIPILNTPIPLSWFFIAAPIILTIIHIYTVAHIFYLSRQTKLFSEALTSAGDAQKKHEKSLIITSLLSSALIKDDSPVFIKAISHVYTIAVFIVAPITTSILFQYYSLPYNDEGILLTQRLSLITMFSTTFYIYNEIFIKHHRSPTLNNAFSIAHALIYMLIVLISLTLFTTPYSYDNSYIKQLLSDKTTTANFIADKDSTINKIILDTLTAIEEFYDSVPRSIHLPNKTLISPKSTTSTSQQLPSGILNKDTSAHAVEKIFSTNISKRVFYNADFSNSIFLFFNFKDTYFDKTNLNGAKIISSTFESSHLIDTNAIGAQFENCKFTDATFTNVNAEKSSITNSTIDNSLLIKFSLNKANIIRTNITHTNFIKLHALLSKFTDTSIFGGSINFSVFNDSKISNTTFHCQISCSSFIGAETRHVKTNKNDIAYKLLQTGSNKDINFLLSNPESHGIISKKNAPIPLTKNTKDKDIDIITTYALRYIHCIEIGLKDNEDVTLSLNDIALLGSRSFKLKQNNTTELIPDESFLNIDTCKAAAKSMKNNKTIQEFLSSDTYPDAKRRIIEFIYEVETYPNSTPENNESPSTMHKYKALQKQ
ncbi:putative membrane protein [Desulfovibrio sp. A2]|nr:putative membrane protein [Desulfovibrio sp. A2]